MTAIHHSAQKGFAAGADAYASGRPDYPAAIVGWLRNAVGLGLGRTVLDLGSGTGGFLPALIRTGAFIVAVEPVEQMRTISSLRHPEIAVPPGTAACIPLADASVDTIVCAQSFHWFATAEAIVEINRVLRPGGTFGLIWNNRDVTVPWVAAIEEVTRQYIGDTPTQMSHAWRNLFPAKGFGQLMESTYSHVHSGQTENVIVQRVLSVSYIASLPRSERDRVVANVRAIIAGSPQLNERTRVTFPYVTKAYHCFKE